MKLKKKNCFIALVVLASIGTISYVTIDKCILNSSSKKYENITEQEEIDEIVEQDKINVDEKIETEEILKVEEKEDVAIEKTKIEEKNETTDNKKDNEKKSTTIEKKEENKVLENQTHETKNESPVIETINVDKIKYDKNLIKMVVGEIIELNPTISPSNATNKELVYSTSNSKIVEVTQDGKVTALKTSLDPAYVYIKSKENPNISFSIKIYVFDDIRISSLNFPKSVETVDIAQNGIVYKLKVNAPIVAADKSKYTYCGIWMEYTSSNPDVARIQASNFDTLYLNKPGTTIITAKYRDGKTAQMELHVINSKDEQRTTGEY